MKGALMDRSNRHFNRGRAPAAGDFSPEFLRPPEPRSATFLLLRVLVFVAVLFVLYQGADAWLKHREAQRMRPVAVPVPTVLPSPAPPVARPEPTTPSAAPPRQPPATAGRPTSSHTVTKCVLQGKTSYSDGPCPEGAAASSVLIERNMNVADSPRTDPSPRAEAALSTAAPGSGLPSPAVRVVNEAAERKAECVALSAYIEQLDAQARQPLSGQRQDWIRQERKQARDRQFALRC
jgi:hypothetical protein